MADEFETTDLAAGDSSEQLDQLQPEDTLVDRGVDDVLDEGYIAPDNWSPAQGFGNTAAEQREGETLEQRIAQEVPDLDPAAPEPPAWDADGEDREVGERRSGRLVVQLDEQGQAVAHEVGIDGGVASAEEAAMHVIDQPKDGEGAAE